MILCHVKLHGFCLNIHVVSCKSQRNSCATCASAQEIGYVDVDLKNYQRYFP